MPEVVHKFIMGIFFHIVIDAFVKTAPNRIGKQIGFFDHPVEGGVGFIKQILD
jgi:hypothetical protein